MITPNKAKRKIEILTRDEVHRMLKACGGPRAIPRRNRALIVLGWRAGLRRAEMLALVPRDVDLDRGTVRVHDGKGHKSRTVGLDAQACDVVHVWLAMRALLPGVGPASPLLCTYVGGQLPRDYPLVMMKRLAAKAKIHKRVDVHLLRHTYAVELVRDGIHVATISQLLGHADIKTTTVYLQGLCPQEAVDAILSRPEWMSVEAPKRTSK